MGAPKSEDWLPAPTSAHQLLHPISQKFETAGKRKRRTILVQGWNARASGCAQSGQCDRCTKAGTRLRGCFPFPSKPSAAMLPLLQSLPSSSGKETDASTADTADNQASAIVADDIRTSVFAWGDDASYQLGYLTGTSQRSTQPRPCQLPPKTVIVQVVAGVHKE